MSAVRLPRRTRAVIDGARTVTVVLPEGEPPDVSALEAPGRSLRLRVHAGGATQLHDVLAADGHADAVVDLVRGRGAARRFALLLAHVRRGGVLVMAVPRRPQARASLLALLEEVRLLHEQGVRPPARTRDRRPVDERDAHALAAAVDQLEVDGDLVVARCRVDTWSVVPEARFDAVLEAAPDLGRVLHRRPAATRTTTASFRSSSSDEQPLTTHEARALSLRAVDDVVVTPRLVAHKRDLVLPQAFRNTEHLRPRTPALADWSRWSVRVPEELAADGAGADRLPGTWFHADNFLRGHFGHAMTEQLSHFWAWSEVLERHPDAGVLVSVAEKPLAGWELELLEAAGVARERVHGAAGPVRVDTLLSATPGYVILQHIHPSLRELYTRTGDTLVSRSGLESTPRRVFVARGTGKRWCHEAAEVEAVFRRFGFTVVTPEEHPLPDQVAMLRHAEAVAGYGGSGMFHLVLGGAPRPMFVVSHTGYHVWNEKAIAALWDHPLTVARGTPDVTTAHFTKAAMHSDYHLDLDREGRVLVDALEAL